MADLPVTTGSGNEDDLFDDLVQLTYATIAEPDKFHDLIILWEKCLTAHVLEEHLEGQDADLAVHFNSALQIFDRIGRMQRDQDRAQKLLESFSIPALICNSERRVVHTNARLTDWLEGADPLDLLADSDLGDQVANWTDGQTIAFSQSPRAGGEAAVITALPEALRGDGQYGRAFLIVFSEVSEDNDVWNSIRSKYGLTEAETGVLVHLARGHKAEEIAELRQVSINTIRAHIRGLLEKSGSRTQNDLIRSSVFLLSQFQSLSLVSRALSPDSQASPVSEARMVLPSGRMLYYREYGAPRGKPVIYLHGMMAGPEIPDHLKKMAAMRNVRILAPSRPGFGKSDTIAATGMDLVRQSCFDLVSFLDMLSIPRAMVIGHLSAVGIGVNFAALFPDRCAGVLNSGYSGVVTDRLIDGMPTMTRSFARTYQRSRTAIRFLTRAAIASVDFMGADRMMLRHLGSSPVDLEYCQKTGAMEMMAEGLRHAIAQGGDAFIRDGYLAVTDWRDAIAKVAGHTPIFTMVGERDKITPHHLIRDELEAMPGYDVAVVPGAGQLVLFQDWRGVLDRIDACFAAVPEGGLPAP